MPSTKYTDMKRITKILLLAIVAFSSLCNAHAQQGSPLEYLERTFPQLTELFKKELSNYPAHYIFAVDVSGTMNKYESVVAQALTPFFQALPNKDRVDVIPFGTDAKISMLGYSGVIDKGVKSTLCTNIKTLYRNDSYSREFKAHTDIPSAVNGIAKVIQNNKEYKVNIVVILTDFRNDQKGVGERKVKEQDLKSMKSAIMAATGDVYTRFIALQLPVDRTRPGYCLDQLRDNVFSFKDYSLEIASIGNDENVIAQWFEQLKRDIMTTKLKAIVHNANKSAPVRLEVDRDIDGFVKAEVHWTPNKLYPTIKIDSTYIAGNDFYFVNNTENFTQTRDSVIKLDLGQVKHNNYGFHELEDDLHLGLSLPTTYDSELEQLEASKPLPTTTVSSPGYVFTFIFTLQTTIIIAILILLYIIGVIKAIARNNSLCFKGNITFYDKNGNQIGDMVRLPKQSSSATLIFGKGGSPRCKVDNADWQFVVEKKKANPFLVFQSPYFAWRGTSKYVASGKSRSGKLTDSVRVSCGLSKSEITHSVKIKLTK